MALNKNTHYVAGTLGRDPEVRITQNGTTICTVAVATKHWDSKEKVEVTDWIRCKIIGKQAEYIGSYGKKGGEIMVEGRVETREYIDKNGQKRTITETVCFDAQLPKIGSRSDNEQPTRPAPQRTNEYAKQSGGRGASQDTRDPDFEDSIPF